MQPLIDAKTCRLCKEPKPLTEYHPNKQCKFGVTGTCKPCSALRVRQWYSDNRSRRQEASNSRNRDRKSKVVAHFGGKCLDCQQSFPQCVYQFHHLDPNVKEKNPSAYMSGRSDKMWNELSKCVMLCANCHLIRHHAVGKEGVDATTH